MGDANRNFIDAILFNMNPLITKPIILASQSPRRKQLLEWACVDFEVMVSKAEEDFDHHLDAEAAALFIASKKAEAVWSQTDHLRPVLAADTIVVCESSIIGKPQDSAQAIEILQMLSGREHAVITGVVIRTEDRAIEFSDTTQVHFHSLSDKQIEFYVKHFAPYDKAGGYAIQEWIGVIGIRSIVGDFYNVMGLPVSRVIHALEELDWILDYPA